MRVAGGAEKGSVTLWMMGLGLLLLTLGGLSVDLWRLIAERRELAVMAEAAAVAAVNAVHEEVFRQTGEIVLQPAEAVELAERSLLAQPGGSDQTLDPDWFVLEDEVTVVVTLRRTVEFTLLRIAGAEPVAIGASARAVADVRP